MGKDIQIKGWHGRSKEKMIKLNTKEIESVSQGFDGDHRPFTTLWTSRTIKSVIHTRLSFHEVMKLIK